MTADDFRRLALALPEAVEAEHMAHPDFRVGGKIFGSLGDKGDVGTVKLTPAEQATFLATDPDGFRPAAGAWGRRGWTTVVLADADETAVRQALTLAWRNTAPEKLAARHADD